MFTEAAYKRAASLKIKVMRFFILNNYSELDGRVPQCDIDPNLDYNYSANYSIWNIDYWKRINYAIRIPEFKLHHQARWTDLINDVSFNRTTSLLASTKMWEVIRTFNLPEFQIFPCTVRKRDLKKDYLFIYFCEIHNQFIDFKKSTFFNTQYASIPPKDPELIQFSDAEAYKKEKDRLLGVSEIGYYEIHLIENIELDLFRIFGFHNAMLISERLKIALEENNITGFQTLPFESISINKTYRKQEL